MTLAIDVTRPARSRSQQELLIEAVVGAAPTEQETDYLEWKSSVDLADKERQVEVARHILGFANRDPEAAGRRLGGCAHLLLGAEPGSLLGVPVHDIAKLDEWLSAYVGKTPDCPVWSATYVRVRDTDCLLVTVEPPNWGDPIWSLRKEYTPRGSNVPWRRGTVFVRRRGRTEQAEQADYVMLARRSSGGRRRLSLTLSVEAGDRVAAVDTLEETAEEWFMAERRALERPEAPKPKSINPSSGTAIADQLAESFRLSDPFLKGLESRSPSEYDAEIDEYIRKARAALRSELARRCVERERGLLHLWVINNTEHNFAEVAVELRFPQPGVRAYLDIHDVEGPGMPRRPAGWRSQKMSDMLGTTYLSTGLGHSTLPGSSPGRRGHVDNSGSSTIRFAPVDVRPVHRHRLEDVYVVVSDDMVGAQLEASWFATATDTSGSVEGVLSIPVSETALTPHHLMTKVGGSASDTEGE